MWRVIFAHLFGARWKEGNGHFCHHNMARTYWRRSSHQLLPYKMAQDEKKPRSRHCSVLLPLTGQRHHVRVWLGKCGVAHIPRGHHSFDSSCSNKQTFFSPEDESRTGPAAFLRGTSPL